MCDVLHLYPTGQQKVLVSHKINSSNLHGTGCTLSSAIATYLAGGQDLLNAVDQAKQYMNHAIEGGRELKIGQGNGPLWHFFE